MGHVYRKRRRQSQASRALAVAAALGPFLAPGVPAAAPLACAASAPRVSVTQSLPPPEIDNTLTQPQLQRTAANHHAGRALGLYRATLNGHFEAQIAMRWDDTEACLWVSSLALRVEALDRRIWIIRERRPGTCHYETVLAHERRHQAVDDAMVETYVARLRSALAREAAALGLVRVAPGERDAAQQRLIDALKKVFQAEMRALQAERERRQNAIDTPAEYRRVGAACSSARSKG
jgi:hypothetical protein